MSEEHSKSHSKIYIAVWITLLILTGVTVYAAEINFGKFNLLIAMAIATVKGTLVALYFMHLKYDNRLNRVVFASAFVFLFVFASFTLSDELTRSEPTLAQVRPIQEPEGANSEKLKKLSFVTAEQVSHGKELFQVNCVSCHGPNGQGDGPASSSLTPKPRNFTSADSWKNGRAPAQIFKTVTEGVSGSAMASFSTLSIEDRWALAHYIHSLTPNPPSDTLATLAAIGVREGTASQTPTEVSIELPISFAIDRLVEEANKK